MKIVNSMLLAAAFCAVAGCSANSAAVGSANPSNAAANTAASPNAAPTTAANTTAAPAQTGAPEAVVKELYKQHDAKNSPFFQTKDRARVDKYFTKKLADAIWKDAVDSEREGGVGALGADPLYDAQDTEITEFKIQPDQVDGDQALVLVTFKNFGKKYNLIFNVVREKSGWKISNITGDNYNLLENLQPAKDSAKNKNNTADGNFEGTYQIGETTCTVKPIKMAFEVKWKQGTGTEIFFFQDRANDKIIFASDPKTGKANVFSFDDESYTTGIFYRADGKEFPIKKIK